MADDVKQVWIFNEGILHCRNRDMENYGGRRVWQFIGGDKTRFYCTKFREIQSTCSQNIELKRKSDINQRP